MLTPKYLEGLPDTLVALYGQAESDILADMARRIVAYDYWIPAAEHQNKMLQEMGATQEYVFAHLAKLTGKSSREIKRLFEEGTGKALKSDREIYQKEGLKPPSLETSEALQTVLNAGLKQTNNAFRNLTRTTAQGAYEQFGAALDRAWLQINTGGFDSNTAIRLAIKGLSAEGVRTVTYNSGKRDNIEVAVRRAIVTGVNQTSLKAQWTLADEMDCDLVEVTAHAGARPSHAVWQGGVYSRSGKSQKYPDFVSTTGYGSGDGLGGWNCRHNFFPYFDGSSRTYTKKQLDEYNEKNYEYNGEKLSEYEASQKQRQMERQIRRWKREYVAMDAAGLDTAESAAKIAKWQEKERNFLKQTGLKRQNDREQIPGYGKGHKTYTGQGNSGIIKEKISFVPAKNIKEAETFVKNTLEIQNVSYKGCDIDTANAWNDGLVDSFNRFPELKKNFGFVGEAHERNNMIKPRAKQIFLEQLMADNPGYSVEDLMPYAEENTRLLMRQLSINRRTVAESLDSPNKLVCEFRGVSINREFGKNAQEFIKFVTDDVQSKFHPVGCNTIRAVLDHEIGHQLDSLLNIGSLEKIQDLYNSRTPEEMTNALSEYAWKNNNKDTYSEMIAEAWSEYCNNPQPREIAKIIGETIEAEYKKKFGR